MPGCLLLKAMCKNKIKTWAESDIKFVWAKTSNLSFWFVWDSIHCELKMDKQDLQARESW